MTAWAIVVYWLIVPALALFLWAETGNGWPLAIWLGVTIAVLLLYALDRRRWRRKA